MAQTRPLRLRPIVYQVHLWVALICLILLVPLGLTGSIIAWPDQMNRILAPPPHAVSANAALAPSAYLAAARAALPDGAQIQGLRLPERAGEPVAVMASVGRPGPLGRRTVWLEPADGKVLRVARSIAPVFTAIHQFHSSMLNEGWGDQVVGWAGVVMFFLALSGIWLWWPRGNAFLRAFRWRRSPSTLLNLHHMVGFWISIPLALLSATGVLISFPGFAGAVLGVQPRAGPPPQQRAPDGRRPAAALTPEQAIGIALAAHRDTPRLVALTLPDGAPRGARVWRVDLAGANGARSTAGVDDLTGRIARPAPRPSLTGQRLNRAIHEADLGPLWKWIVTLTGFAPAVLAVTGAIAWAKAQRRRARLRQDPV